MKGKEKPEAMETYFENPGASPIPGPLEQFKYPWEFVKDKMQVLGKIEPQILGSVHPSSVLEGEVKVEKGAEVGPFCVLEGPVVIGEGSTVRPHAWLRGPVLIGKNCVVGKGVELKNSLLFDEAKIGTNCFVGDSVLGKGARVGSGTILGNRRFDQKEIEIRIGKIPFPTGMDKFGAVLGDYSRMGAGLTTSPGTLVGKHSWVLCSVQGIIPPGKLVLEKKGKLTLKDKEKTVLGRLDSGGKA